LVEPNKKKGVHDTALGLWTIIYSKEYKGHRKEKETRGEKKDVLPPV